MFIRKTQRQYKGKTYTNHLLVESVHTSKGPRQRVICSLGDLGPKPKSEWLKLARKLEKALSGQADLVNAKDPDVDEILSKIKSKQSGEEGDPGCINPEEGGDEKVSVNPDKVRTENHREAGSLHVGYQFYMKLGINEILDEIGLNERARKLTCAMVLNRLISPCAEYAMPEWFRTSAIEDILGGEFEETHEDALYRNLDRLYPNRDAIETALFNRETSIFNLDRTVYLYDLTSTYFEGNAEKNPKAKRGYSRDKRPDCKQVVIGLVINREGFPMGHEIFEGNTQDRKTVGKMLDLLDKRVGIAPGQTVVVDRGMAYAENIREIKAKNLHYIIATRQTERDQFLEEFEDGSEFIDVIREPSPRNPFQKKSQVKVKMKVVDGETYVLCHSAERTEKDRAIREKQEGRFMGDLKKLDHRIEKGSLKNEGKIGEAIGRLKERYSRVARYYSMSYDGESHHFAYEMNEAKRKKAEELDGTYLLRTDRSDLTAEEAWRIYIMLTRVENAFRSIKSPLMERPIFHQKEQRVDTHIFLCILAYHLLVAIEKTLLDKGIHTSWKTVREILSSHQISTVVLPLEDGAELRIRRDSVPEAQHAQIYDWLKIPHRIMKPRKTWVQPEEQHSDEKKLNPLKPNNICH